MRAFVQRLGCVGIMSPFKPAHNGELHEEIVMFDCASLNLRAVQKGGMSKIMFAGKARVVHKGRNHRWYVSLKRKRVYLARVCLSAVAIVAKFWFSSFRTSAIETPSLVVRNCFRTK